MLRELRSAPNSQLASAPAQMMEAISRGCATFPPLGTSAKAERLRRQIDAGAWTDAAMSLVALELPDWHIRRIQCDDGEWFCSITRTPAVPAEIADEVDGRHRLLPLAIIDALMEAKRRPTTPPARPPSDDWGRETARENFFCENCS